MLGSSLIDVLGTIPLGAVSAQAIVSICYFAAGLFLLPPLPLDASLFTTTLLPLVVFIFWAITSLAWSSAVPQGLQNLVILCTRLIMIQVSAATARNYLGFALQLQRLVN